MFFIPPVFSFPHTLSTASLCRKKTNKRECFLTSLLSAGWYGDKGKESVFVSSCIFYAKIYQTNWPEWNWLRREGNSICTGFWPSEPPCPSSFKHFPCEYMQRRVLARATSVHECSETVSSDIWKSSSINCVGCANPHFFPYIFLPLCQSLFLFLPSVPLYLHSSLSFTEEKSLKKKFKKAKCISEIQHTETREYRCSGEAGYEKIPLVMNHLSQGKGWIQRGEARKK